MISVQVNNLTKKYNQHTIFSELNFEHEKGVLGISGENGSGKSTLMKCLVYLLRPNAGSISWKNGPKLMGQKQVKAKVGYLAPYINLYSELSVLENLRFLIEAGGIKADEDQLSGLLGKMEIIHLKDQLFGKLSTGQQQRAKLAAALVRDPQILLLDEPGSNLDKKGHELVTRIVREASEAEKLVFIASNDPAEIALCDEVVEL
ncbi:MAG TPA: ABC transporter ATP-binding protein [Gracilimonas sp.]|uniref:ABC transporter ATP-binding protein n=1 Tax=Gracilimonas sp. TaxID=1974203 RepID=UPI002D97745E|nr:ABC transporter ATP-binding protein [Gracilimonas sp.]